MLKLCKRCGNEKPLVAFHSDARRRDGKSDKCLSCQGAIRRAQKDHANKQHYKRYGSGRYAAKRAEWHARNPGKKYEYHCKRYETFDGRAAHLFNSARRRTPDGFALTLNHVISELRKGHCPATGIPFDMNVNRNGKRNRSWSPFAPSLDKIDSRKPYTNENTRVVIWQYNVMKGEMSDTDVVALCKQIVERAARA